MIAYLRLPMYLGIVTSLGENLEGIMIQGIRETMTETEGLVGSEGQKETEILIGIHPGRGLEVDMIQSSTEGLRRTTEIMTEEEIVDGQNTTEDRLLLVRHMTETEKGIGIGRTHLLVSTDHRQKEVMTGTGTQETFHHQAGDVPLHHEVCNLTFSIQIIIHKIFLQVTDAIRDHHQGYHADEVAPRHHRCIGGHHGPHLPNGSGLAITLSEVLILRVLLHTDDTVHLRQGATDGVEALL
jgi:hypothetical protein